ATSSKDDHAPGFDVYATPFVQQAVKVVNSSQGIVIETRPIRSLDLTEYANATLGQLLLPQVPRPIDLDPAVLPSSWKLAPATYEVYFRSWLNSEISCQKKENDTYSLYECTAVVTFARKANDPATCTIVVPGLREYSPYIEEDDVVELRQLRYEPSGNNMVTLVRQMPPWTGIIYRGRVSAVVRAKEVLVLQVNGLAPHTAELWRPHGTYYGLSTEHKLVFNVQFPVPDERYRPMIHVLPHIQVALKSAALNTMQQADSAGTVGTKVFHYWVQSMLFPTEADCDQQSNLHSGNFNQTFVDEKLNWEQKNAVENVCLQNYGTVPYIISGPPGTGKTKTLIETALQLLKNVEQVSHILICAPSEPATDTLADRLRLHLAPHEMLRLNRPQRAFSEVIDELLPYCYVSESMFALPPFAELMKYKVVVTSCRDASLLMYSRMTNSDLYAVEYGLSELIHPSSHKTPSEVKLHWTALLLDEAAQALEPEALLPMHVVSPPQRAPKLAFTPLVVMAGDECQLGPRTSSPKTPLKQSLFARLFSRPVYADHPLARGKTGQAPPPLTKSMLPILRPAFTNLIRNYRSHPAILAVPSSLFYFDTLQSEALPSTTMTLANWSGWHGRKWPVLFHHNPSPDDLERDGGGWFNKGEIQLACGYAARLSHYLGRQQEVCIMSPFKSQVRLLRQKARTDTMGLRDVNIGPTEAFQGLEHGVVILCVTRSSKRFVEKDKELSWGIIGQPNKMNVALTRAKYGLIIIGNRDVLVDD
ncbi:P-loop containing nucleoside triphosphate hydrolase protein, partial [Coniochaeta ligniaria NRRL 30616]